MVFCFLKITNLYCVCVLLPTACIRRCVKEFILLAEIQGKWLKETHSAVQNIREKKPLFRLACISTLRLKVGTGWWKSFPFSAVTLWGRVCLVKYSWVSVR